MNALNIYWHVKRLTVETCHIKKDKNDQRNADAYDPQHSKENTGNNFGFLGNVIVSWECENYSYGLPQINFTDMFCFMEMSVFGTITTTSFTITFHL